MREKGMTRKDIHRRRYPTTLKSKISENQLRVISREYERAKEIFANIEKGTFP